MAEDINNLAAKGLFTSEQYREDMTEEDLKGGFGKWVGLSDKAAEGVSFDLGHDMSLDSTIMKNVKSFVLNQDKSSPYISEEEAKNIAPNVEVKGPIRKSALDYMKAKADEHQLKRELLGDYYQNGNISSLQQLKVGGAGMLGGMVGISDLLVNFAPISKVALWGREAIVGAAEARNLSGVAKVIGEIGESTVAKAALQGGEAAVTNYAAGKYIQSQAGKFGIDYTDKDLAIETLAGFALGGVVIPGAIGIMKRGAEFLKEADVVTKGIDKLSDVLPDGEMRDNLKIKAVDRNIGKFISKEVSLLPEVKALTERNTSPETLMMAMQKGVSDIIRARPIEIEDIIKNDPRYKISTLPKNDIDDIINGSFFRKVEGREHLIEQRITPEDSAVNITRVTTANDDGILGTVAFNVYNKKNIPIAKRGISDIYKLSLSEDLSNNPELIARHQARADELGSLIADIKNGAVDIEEAVLQAKEKKIAGAIKSIKDPEMLVDLIDDELQIHQKVLDIANNAHIQASALGDDLKSLLTEGLSSDKIFQEQVKALQELPAPKLRLDRINALQNFEIPKIEAAIRRNTREVIKLREGHGSFNISGFTRLKEPLMNINTVLKEETLASLIKDIDAAFSDLSLKYGVNTIGDEAKADSLKNLMLNFDATRADYSAYSALIDEETFNSIVDLRTKLGETYRMSVPEIKRMFKTVVSRMFEEPDTSIDNLDLIEKLRAKITEIQGTIPSDIVGVASDNIDELDKLFRKGTPSHRIADIIHDYYDNKLADKTRILQDQSRYLNTYYALTKKGSPFKNRPKEAVKKLLVNINVDGVDGSRYNLENVIRAENNRRLSSLQSEMIKYDMWELYADTKHTDGIREAWKYIENPESFIGKPVPEIIYQNAAGIIRKHYLEFQDALNARGTNLKTFGGVFKVDPEKITNAKYIMQNARRRTIGEFFGDISSSNRKRAFDEGKQLLWERYKDKFNTEEMFNKHGAITLDEQQKHFNDILEDITKEKFFSSREGVSAILSDSPSRIIFKDVADELEFLSLFGHESLGTQIEADFDRASRSFGLMSVLGSEHKQVLRDLHKDVMSFYNIPNASSARDLKRMESILDQIDGTTDYPLNMAIASIGNWMRTLELRKIWATTFKSESDILNAVNSITNLFSRADHKHVLGDLIPAMTKLAVTDPKTAEKMAARLGLFSDVMQSEIQAAYSMSGAMNNLLNKTQRKFSKLSLIQSFTNAILRASTAVISSELADVFERAVSSSLKEINVRNISREKVSYFRTAMREDSILRKAAIAKKAEDIRAKLLGGDKAYSEKQLKFLVNKELNSIDKASIAAIKKEDLETIPLDRFKEIVNEERKFKKGKDTYTFDSDEDYITYRDALSGKVEKALEVLSPDDAKLFSKYLINTNLNEHHIIHELGRISKEQMTEFLGKESDFGNTHAFISPNELSSCDLEKFKEVVQRAHRSTPAGNNKVLETDADYKLYRDELANKVANIIDDVSYEAITAPRAEVKSYLYQGGQRGTGSGELTRTMVQFKSFPTARLIQDFGRIINKGRDLNNANHATVAGWLTSPEFRNLDQGPLLEFAGFFSSVMVAEYAGLALSGILLGKSLEEMDKNMAMKLVERTSIMGPIGNALVIWLSDEEMNKQSALLSELLGPSLSTGTKTGLGLLNALQSDENQATKAYQLVVKSLVTDSFFNYPVAGILWRAAVADNILNSIDPYYTADRAEKAREKGQDIYFDNY